MKIAKQSIEQLPVSDEDKFYWDDTLKGFGIKVYKSGRKSFVVQSRLNGEVKRYTIGTFGSPWTAETARKEALKYLAAIANGVDPSAEKRQRRDELKVKKLASEYLRVGNLHKKQSTRELEARLIERHIIPLLGTKRISAINKGGARKFLSDVANGKSAADIKTKPRGRAIVTGGEGTANRAIAVLSAIYTYANENEIYDKNPVKGIKLYKLKEHVRYLAPEELERLSEALISAETRYVSIFAISAIRFLLLTGCRKGEALSLRWEQVDMDNLLVYLPDSKVGQRPLYLGQAVIDLLQELPRVEGSPLVFPSSVGGETQISLQQVWSEIRKEADLEDVRLNDLRHNFASATVSAGQSLYLTSKLLGHKNQRTTERYAHMAPHPVKEAANIISGGFSKIMSKKRKTESKE